MLLTEYVGGRPLWWVQGWSTCCPFSSIFTFSHYPSSFFASPTQDDYELEDCEVFTEPPSYEAAREPPPSYHIVVQPGDSADDSDMYASPAPLHVSPGPARSVSKLRLRV